MIPASEKAKLEEMSSIRCTGTVQGGFDPDCYKCRDFMAGAQAAWDLAVKYERERLLKMHGLVEAAVYESKSFAPWGSEDSRVKTHLAHQEDVLKHADRILTPPQSDRCKHDVHGTDCFTCYPSDEGAEGCNQCGDLNGENIGTIYSSCCSNCELSFPNGYPVGQCTFCLGTGIVKNKEGNNIDVIKRMAPKGYFCR